MSKQYTATITTLPESRFELKGEIAWEHFATFEDASFSKLANNVELAGFRKGNVPKDMAKKHIPDEIVLGDMAEAAINDVYPKMLQEHSLDVIGRPEVSITKMARGNPLEFTITLTVVPTIKLPDYKTIASGIKAEEVKEVTQADIEKVIENLQQMRAYGHVHEEGSEHKHEEPLPEANDEFAKSFGNFASMDEMRDKIKENLVAESHGVARDKRRIGIMEAIIKETSFEVPALILDSEKQKMLAQIEADVSRSGASLEDYLTHIKKTKEELLAEFTPEADKRARFQLVLNTIARTEGTLPTEEEVETEAAKFMQQYPGADPNRTKAYADMVLTNEKVFAMLEGK